MTIIRGFKMLVSYEVKCINKSSRMNHYERILNIGGVNPDRSRWKLSQIDAILGMEKGNYAFFVNVNGHSVWLMVSTSANGNKYLKTQNDGEQPNNLLSLPECP